MDTTPDVKPSASRTTIAIVVLVLIVAVGIAVPVALLTGGSDGDPSPPPSPGRPPPSLLSSSVVSFDVLASGIVSDYGDAKKAALAQAVATKTGVDASSVTVSVVAASVRIAIELTARRHRHPGWQYHFESCNRVHRRGHGQRLSRRGGGVAPRHLLHVDCNICLILRRLRPAAAAAAVTVAAAVAAAVSTAAGDPRSRPKRSLPRALSTASGPGTVYSAMALSGATWSGCSTTW